MAVVEAHQRAAGPHAQRNAEVAAVEMRPPAVAKVMAIVTEVAKEVAAIMAKVAAEMPVVGLESVTVAAVGEKMIDVTVAAVESSVSAAMPAAAPAGGEQNRRSAPLLIGGCHSVLHIRSAICCLSCARCPDLKGQQKERDEYESSHRFSPFISIILCFGLSGG